LLSHGAATQRIVHPHVAEDAASEQKQAGEQTPVPRANDESLSDRNMESVSGGLSIIGISPLITIPIMPPPTFPTPPTTDPIQIDPSHAAG
jgi:hypothetical protein